MAAPTPVVVDASVRYTEQSSRGARVSATVWTDDGAAHDVTMTAAQWKDLRASLRSRGQAVRA